MQKRMTAAVIGLVLLLGMSACNNKPTEPEMNVEDQVKKALETNAGGNVLVVPLDDQQGITRATAMIKEVDKGLEMKVEANHLRAGKYGFHFHERGSCEAPDFVTAGDHFNPEGKSHGLKHEEGPHAGDMENIVVKADGTVKQTFIIPHLSLEKEEESSLFHPGGTSLIMHEEEDDGISQPAGEAGKRMLCGVVADEKE